MLSCSKFSIIFWEFRFENFRRSVVFTTLYLSSYTTERRILSPYWKFPRIRTTEFIESLIIFRIVSKVNTWLHFMYSKLKSRITLNCAFFAQNTYHLCWHTYYTTNQKNLQNQHRAQISKKNHVDHSWSSQIRRQKIEKITSLHERLHFADKRTVASQLRANTDIGKW